jgi:O-antigen/teichoic acid export membrane protein
VDLFVRINLLLGILAMLACFHSAGWLVALLFGDAFAAAAIVLEILSASFALKFVLFALQTVLTTAGRHAARTRSLAIATTAAFIGHAILIPQQGAAGAAVAVVAAETLLLILYTTAISDAMLKTRLLRRLAVGIAAMAAGVFLPTALGLAGPAASLAGILAAIVVVIASGFVTIREIVAIKQQLR